ncbi:MAG TPA: hypothetical protein VG755_24765 [Nannocystaceae bacterium]|nr:hypothetical protein [Nannocystaceae bacterium]
MSRAKKPSRHCRAELLILVKQQLERAGEHAISTDELLTALAPTGISRRTLERILSDLRTKHDANLSTSGKRRRWRLESPLPLPLDAPDRRDLIALRYAIAMAKPLLPPTSAIVSPRSTSARRARAQLRRVHPISRTTTR